LLWFVVVLGGSAKLSGCSVCPCSGGFCCLLSGESQSTSVIRQSRISPMIIHNLYFCISYAPIFSFLLMFMNGCDEAYPAQYATNVKEC
jgi:hypothetical protein